MVRNGRTDAGGRIVIGHRENASRCSSCLRQDAKRPCWTSCTEHRVLPRCGADRGQPDDAGQWLDRWLTEYKVGTVRPVPRGLPPLHRILHQAAAGRQQISLSPAGHPADVRRLKTRGHPQHPEMGHQLSDSMVRHIHSPTTRTERRSAGAHHSKKPHRRHDSAQAQLQAQAHSHRAEIGCFLQWWSRMRCGVTSSKRTDDRPAPRRDLRSAVERLRWEYRYAEGMRTSTASGRANTPSARRRPIKACAPSSAAQRD